MSDTELLEAAVVGRLYTNCYFLKSGDHLAVIDPGGDARLISEKIDHYGCRDVSLIATHCHFDHILAAHELQEKHGCEFFIHRKEKEYLEPSVALSLRFFDTALEIPDCTFVSKEGDLPIGLEFIETPGHTPGSICVISGNMMFTGDTLFNGSIGRTDFFGSQDDMKASLRNLYLNETDYSLYPGHGPQSTLNSERKNNHIFRTFAGVE